MSGVFFLLADQRAQRLRCRNTTGKDSMTQSSLENAVSGHAQPLAEVVPGYSANTPTNEDTDQFATAFTPAQESQASSSKNPSKKCACLVCLEVGVPDHSEHGPEQCRFIGCNRIRISRFYDLRHERSHYLQSRGPKEPQSPFYCPVENCRYRSNRWSDLRRHTTTKHCSDPVKLACSVIGCKHSGEGNGFTRPDKLKAHYESMHRGQRVPGQVSRALRPAPVSSYAEASGSSSNSA